jgi:cytochrome oxidase assembly protein ShyY1
MYRGEKGVQIITPFYTHIGKDGKPAAILVNRGWVPNDYKNQRKHIVNGSGTITGVLYQGDAKTKYSKPNSPTI